nr:MAG TPA: hypothetical protein [Caudoviricetes sp.]
MEHLEYATTKMESVVLFLQIKIHNFPAIPLALWSFSMIFMTLIRSA